MKNNKRNEILTDYVNCSGMNLGGLGCGGIEIWPDGVFRHPAFMNSRPWAGRSEGHNYHIETGGIHDEPEFRPEDMFFLLRVQQKGKKPQMRFLLKGHALAFAGFGNMSRLYKYAHIPAIKAIRYKVEYPFAVLDYEDETLPVSIGLKAWYPFIPHDEIASSTPGAVFDFTINNKTNEELDITLIYAASNLAGYTEELNQKHEVKMEQNKAVIMMMGGINPKAPSTGCMSVFACAGESQKITCVESNPYLENLLFPIYYYGDLDGPMYPSRLQKIEYIQHRTRDNYTEIRNKAWIAVRQNIASKEAQKVRFGLSWFFPNHYDRLGNYAGKYYENRFKDSSEVAKWLINNADELEKKAQVLPRQILNSCLDEAFALSLLDQLNVLSKSSWFTKDGGFYLWEGHGCCCLNTVDVDHYSSFGLIHLFPGLRKKVADLVRNEQLENGQIVHGFPLVIRDVKKLGKDEYRRWDVNLQYILAVYRDWKWTGDEDFLCRHYESIMKAFDFTCKLDIYDLGLPYIEGGITYDHWHMKGIITYMAGLFLTACQAVIKLASHKRDDRNKKNAEQILEKGRINFEKLLWNGENYGLYYLRKNKDEQENKIEVQRGQIAGDMGDFDPDKVLQQKGKCSSCCCAKDTIEVRDDGLMTDALNGEAFAIIAGLPRSLDRQRVLATLRKIISKNYINELGFVVNGSYEDESFPDEWCFSQWQNPWTGSEYYFAAQLIAEGMVDEALSIISDVYDRYDREGMRFNHIECSEHYARPLSIYAAYDAFLGADFDVPLRKLSIKPVKIVRDTTIPLMLPALWADIKVDGNKVDINIFESTAKLKVFEFANISVEAPLRIEYLKVNGENIEFTAFEEARNIQVLLKNDLELQSGMRISFEIN